MKAVWTYLTTNWKTNLAAVAAFAWSVPQFVTAVTAWEHNQPADWKGAIVALILSAGLFAAKDASTHSTQLQVAKATSDAIVNGNGK